jgi:hypothetical protein
MTTRTIPADNELFDGGPPRRLETALGLVKPDKPKTIGRAALVSAIAWVPLVLLAAMQSFALGQDKLSDLLFDFAVHARYLVAAPLFIAAEAFTLSTLGKTARHFVSADLIRVSDRPRFESIAAGTRRLLNSTVVEIVVLLLAYFGVIVLIRMISPETIPSWHKLTKEHLSFSWAGWWHTVVSIPLFLILLFGWLWRLFLWGVFLWRVSRLDLHLVPAHPDLSGGLQFVGASLRAFPLLSFALGAVVAGGVANRVVHQGMHLIDFKYIIATLLVAILIVFVAPLTFFTREILQTRRRGIFEYGALAGAVGRQMERKWIERNGSADETALDVQHFSATTDLYQLVANVYQVKSVPLDLQDLIAVVIAVLLPFVPVLLFEIPLDIILPDLMKLLL